MALDLSKLNFFNRLDARSRVAVLLVGVVGVIFLIYLGTKSVSGETAASGPSKVAAPPPGLQSVPGGQLTPEYYRALQESNVQAAKQAQMSGGSAVPTLVRTGSSSSLQSADCTVVCPDKTASVSANLDDWLKRGAVTPEVAKQLGEVAKQNVPVSEYAEMLNDLVKQGKITPEQARELLASYDQQRAEDALQEGAVVMDTLIKGGQMPLDAANQLLAAQKAKASTTEYAALLQKMVKEGKLTPAAAQQLLAQYTQQKAKEVVAGSVASLRKMARDGEITKSVEDELVGLENRMVSVDVYNAALDRNVTAGNLTPVAAKKILDEFKAQKAAIGPTGSLEKRVQDAEAAAYGEVDELLQAGKISQEVGDKLRDMLRRNVPMPEFVAAINQFVQQNKLSPEIAKLKLADYKEVTSAREAAATLTALQGNNATQNQYADELKRMVQKGVITPDQAVQLMQEYQAVVTKAPVPVATPAGQAASSFARLQQEVQADDTGAAPGVPATAQEFALAEDTAMQESMQQQQERIQNLSTAMSGQAQQLVASWQPPVMLNKAATPAIAKTDGSGTGDGAAGSAQGASGASSSTAPQGPVMIKAGSVMFAVLDTEANSDYPDSPVMATIVEGKYKGAKLMGKLMTTKGVAGQMDRISLNFTLMNVDTWPKSKTVTAYAVDPEKARTVMATNVNYHYMQRFGAIMATSFLQGYAGAITNAGTSSTSLGTTTSTHPELNPSSKLMVGLGQIGTALGTVTQNYTNIPPTVRVDSGVGVGILFMSDVT